MDVVCLGKEEKGAKPVPPSWGSSETFPGSSSVWYNQRVFAMHRMMVIVGFLLLFIIPPLSQSLVLSMLRTVFSFQALSKSEAKGRILQYTVTFEALNRGGPKAEVTTQTSYTRTTAKLDYRITVTADNSRGSSPPAVIITDLGIGGKGLSHGK